MWTVDSTGDVIKKTDKEQMNKTLNEKYQKPMFAFTTESSFLEAEKWIKKCGRGLGLQAEEGYGFVVTGTASTSAWRRALTTIKNQLKSVKIIKEDF